MKNSLVKYYPLFPVLAAYLAMFLIGFFIPGMWQMVAMLAFYCALGQSWNIFMGMTGYVDFGYVTFIALGTYGMSLGIAYFYKFEWLGIGIIFIGILLALFSGLFISAFGGVYRAEAQRCIFCDCLHRHQ
jgi:branched-chain amino acid transport system permease protein